MSNNDRDDRLNQQLLALFREIERVKAAKSAAPPPPEVRDPWFKLYSELDRDGKRQRLLKLGAGFAATLGGIALALYLNYGSFTPCGALHAKARALFTTAVGTNSPFALLVAGTLPIEALVDAGLTKRFGSAGPLQCSYVLLSPDWDQAMRDAMRDGRTR